MMIILPIPNSKLAINKTHGQHWSKTYSLKKKARADGYYLAREAYKNVSHIWGQYDQKVLKGEWMLKINCFFANKKRLDEDNLSTAIKSLRDGVFDFLKQKFNMNDRQITLTMLDVSFIDKEKPRIEWYLGPRY